MTKAQLIALLTATSVGFGVGKLTDFTSSKTGASGTFIHATRVTPQGVTAWRTEARAQTDGGVLLTDVGEAACGALTSADIVERERAVARCPLAHDDRPQVWEARPAPALPDGGAQVAIEVYGRSSRCTATVPRWAGLQRWLDGLKCTTVVVNAGDAAAVNDAARHHVAATLPTSTRADPTPPRLPRAKPVQSDVERALERIDGTLVDLRAEVADWTGQQKRGNRISLEVQGDVRRLEKKVDAGFKTLRAQNDQILKLLLKRLPK